MTINPAGHVISEFQYVPVPNEHVPAVMEFLSSRLSDANGIARQPPATQASRVSGAPAAWTDEDLRRFMNMGTKTCDIVTRMLDLLCENPGEQGALATSALRSALNVDYNVMKNVPTQIGRTLPKHFPGRGPLWTSEWGNNFTPARGGEMYFWLTAEQAAQWKRVRS